MGAVVVHGENFELIARAAGQYLLKLIPVIPVIGIHREHGAASQATCDFENRLWVGLSNDVRIADTSRLSLTHDDISPVNRRLNPDDRLGSSRKKERGSARANLDNLIGRSKQSSIIS